MRTFKNEFSWSISRDNIFRKCRRMYYFHYYGSWGGWEDDADDRTKTIYILKQLQTRQMWAGKKVHECIEKAIKNIHGGIETINVEQSIDETLNAMRQEFKDSKKKRYLNEPKTCALFEHEYGLPIPDAEWKNIADHVVTCLNHFFDSDVYSSICQLSDEQWLEVEKFSHFQHNGVRIYAVLDLGFRDRDEIIIYDWKTGKEESNDYKLQLACYGLYAMQQWGIEPEQLKMIEFYLSNKKQNTHNMKDLELDQIREHIGISIKEMKEMLDAPGSNIASEDRFPFSENEQTCKYCNYYKVCPSNNASFDPDATAL